MTKEDRTLYVIITICIILAAIVLFLNREIVMSEEAPLMPRTEILNVAVSDTAIVIEYEIYGWVQKTDNGIRSLMIEKTGQRIDTYAARNDSIYLKETKSAKYVPAKEEQWIWQ